MTFVDQNKRIVYTAVLCLLWVGSSLQHGRMMRPVQRSSMWRKGYPVPANYNDNQLFCGGRDNLQRLGGKCGVCGDDFTAEVRDNEAGGKYALGIIAEKYPAGTSSIHVTIEVTAYHRGYFEFRLCPHNDPSIPVSQECLNRYPLPIAEATGEDPTKYYPPDTGTVDIMVYIPPHIVCSHCVLQWRYRTGNSWGQGADGKSCLGCGVQEEFRNCADISIGAESGLPNTEVTLGDANLNDGVHGNTKHQDVILTSEALGDLTSAGVPKQPRPLPPVLPDRDHPSRDSVMTSTSGVVGPLSSLIHKSIGSSGNTKEKTNLNSNNEDHNFSINKKIAGKEMNGRIQFVHENFQNKQRPKSLIANLKQQITIKTNTQDNNGILSRDVTGNGPKKSSPNRVQSSNVFEIGGAKFIDVKPWSPVAVETANHVTNSTPPPPPPVPYTLASSSKPKVNQAEPMTSSSQITPTPLLTQILTAIKTWQERLERLQNIVLQLSMLSRDAHEQIRQKTFLGSNGASHHGWHQTNIMTSSGLRDVTGHLSPSSAAHAYPLPEDPVSPSRTSVPDLVARRRAFVLDIRLRQAQSLRNQVETSLQALSDRAFAEIDRMTGVQNREAMGFRKDEQLASVLQTGPFAYPLTDEEMDSAAQNPSNPVRNPSVDDNVLHSASNYQFSFPMDTQTEQATPMSSQGTPSLNTQTGSEKPKVRLYVNEYNTVASDSLEAQSRQDSVRPQWYDDILITQTENGTSV